MVPEFVGQMPNLFKPHTHIYIYSIYSISVSLRLIRFVLGELVITSSILNLFVNAIRILDVLDKGYDHSCTDVISI